MHGVVDRGWTHRQAVTLDRPEVGQVSHTNQDKLYHHDNKTRRAPEQRPRWSSFEPEHCQRCTGPCWRSAGVASRWNLIRLALQICRNSSSLLNDFRCGSRQGAPGETVKMQQGEGATEEGKGEDGHLTPLLLSWKTPCPPLAIALGSHVAYMIATLKRNIQQDGDKHTNGMFIVISEHHLNKMLVLWQPHFHISHCRKFFHYTSRRIQQYIFIHTWLKQCITYSTSVRSGIAIYKISQTTKKVHA